MENNFLLAIFVLLAATVALVPFAKLLGLGTIIGYLAAGVLIGPYGFKLISDTDTIRHVSEFGVVMMLFLIGLELQPSELWRMRHKVLGLGLTQLTITAAALGGLVYAAGLDWTSALIVGLALAMSSTAIAMQSIAQRDITKTDTGRSSLAILLVQDVAVIPILAAIPILAVLGGSPSSIIGDGLEDAAKAAQNPVDWMDAVTLVGAFVATILAGRFLARPFLHFVARTGVREAFTALGLALVIGASLLTQFLGLSPALGAFLGGMLLADSEYRHELESNLEPFKGLLLGLFFISVGMSIAFSVVAVEPWLVFAMVLMLVGIKIAVLFGLATIFRMHIADRLLLAVLLSQSGEFAFVILGFAGKAGALTPHDAELLTVVVALSMAATPLLLFGFDRISRRLLAGNDSAGGADIDPAIDGRQKVIVLGYGRFGQILTRLLKAQGFQLTLIDDDPAQIETVKRFGVKVFYGDGARLDLLDAAGAREAQMIVIAVGGAERILAIAAMVRRNFPHVKVAARAIDRNHAHDLMALGVDVLERETFRSAISLGAKALMHLGYDEEQANRLASAFEKHDNKLLLESYALREDEDAYIGLVRRSMETLGEVMRADLEDAKAAKEAGPVSMGHIDRNVAARSE
jgi:glutathione-regulated potassium-efflux system ancillary protein KefC